MKTILVVDEESEGRKSVEATLTRNGYRVLSADTGENAIRLFRTNPDTDLLLTDVFNAWNERPDAGRANCGTETGYPLKLADEGQ
jgi:two-component system, cell cycle sensor histidine kinase and response regulator CckA